ncbi:MAG: DUF1018 domain-containing protein [Treponema sp.]|nr:DUF1018 domain-containing protein [Treponema sp.]
MDNRSNRSRLISKIHAQKNAAGLDDATYRLIISGASGKQSCTECSMKELKQIFTDLNSFLEKQGKQTFRYYPRWEQPTVKDAVTARAKKILGDDWENRLNSFTQTKFSKAKYILCTNAELLSVMAFLTNVERRAEDVKK